MEGQGAVVCFLDIVLGWIRLLLSFQVTIIQNLSLEVLMSTVIVGTTLKLLYDIYQDDGYHDTSEALEDIRVFSQMLLLPLVAILSIFHGVLRYILSGKGEKVDMSEEEMKKPKNGPRRKIPIQYMKRKGDESYYVINTRVVEDPILPCLRWGEPCEPMDDKITLKNLCWFHSASFGTRRLLFNGEGKLRIPSDGELRKIYTNTDKKEDSTFTVRGFEIRVFDPRWEALKDKKPKKASTKRKKISDKTDTEIIELKKKLKLLEGKKKKKHKNKAKAHDPEIDP